MEKCFDDLKNQLDTKRLRMHSSATVDGRLFVQFIALIYISALRREMRKTTLIERYTVRELLQEMDTLTKVKYSVKYRRRGDQRVHVEHVHIHGGAQAIVGIVTTWSGMNQKLEEGPHAKV